MNAHILSFYDSFRLFTWLKFKLFMRSLARSPGLSISFFLASFGFLWGTIFSFFFLLKGFTELEPHLRFHLLYGLLLLVYFALIIAGLANVELHERIDITKLLHYPLTFPRLFWLTLISSLLEPQEIPIAMYFLAIVIGFSSSFLSLIFIIVSLVLFYLHALALFILLNFLNFVILRSKRLAEIATLTFLGTLSACIIFILKALIRSGFFSSSGLSASEIFEPIINSRLWTALMYSPPGIIAYSVKLFQAHNFLLAVLFLLFIALFTLVTVYLSSLLMQRIYSGAVCAPQVFEKAGRGTFAAIMSLLVNLEWLRMLFRRPEFSALIEKEVKVNLREPYVQGLLAVPLVILFGGFIGIPVLEGVTPDSAKLVVILAISGLLLIFWTSFTFNIFGFDRQAVQSLFLFGVRRRHFFLAKNITFLAWASILNLIVLLVLGLVTSKIFFSLICYLGLELALIVLSAIGNFLSVLFPIPVGVSEWRPPPQSFVRGVYHIFVLYLAIILGLMLAMPSILPIILPAIFNSLVWLWISLPFSISYTFFLYLALCSSAESLLGALEPYVVARLKEKD